MYIYNYDSTTKEYLNKQIADANPEETRIRGEFIPLIPANATLLEIPKYEENQIPVFNGNEWEVKADYRKNYKLVDENLNISDINTIGEQEGIVVTNELAEEIKQNPMAYKIVDNNVVKKTNEEIEQDKISERENTFKNDFIKTSWGWFRKQPKGYANAPQSIDIILNMVNAMNGFTEQIKNLMIFYEKPNFTEPEQCTEEWLIANQYHHDVCTVAEFLQFYIDFQTRWAQEQYK